MACGSPKGFCPQTPLLSLKESLPPVTVPHVGREAWLRTAYTWIKCNPEERFGMLSWLLTCQLLSLNCVQHRLWISLQEVLLLWWLNVPDKSFVCSLSMSDHLPFGIMREHVTNQILVASQDLSTISLEGTLTVF